MRIGVDLGGTKIEAAALSDQGKIEVRRRVATPRGDYLGTLRQIVDLVEDIERGLGARCSVGIGMPGALSTASGLVKNANSTCLIGHPFDRDLAVALGRPIRVANDANCFALSEALDGAAAGASTVFGAILGTGVGGGIVVDGKLLNGANAIAGEWGHNALPRQRPDEYPGPRCYCGRYGCIEAFLSGPALVDDWQATLGGDRHAPGETSGGAAVVAAARAGDAAAAAALERYQDRLARALALVINIVDPEVIVLGGGLSQIDSLYQSLPQLLPEHVFSDRVDTQVRPPKHGDSSGVRGAAWLWSKEEAAEARGNDR